MKARSFWFFFLLFPLVPGWALASLDTLYECVGPKKEALVLFREGKALQAKEMNSAGKTIHTWVLNFEKSFLDDPKEPIRYGSTLPALNEVFSWEKMFEFREQLTRVSNPQWVEVTFIKQGHLLKDWKCQQKQGVAWETKLLTDPESQTEADTKWNTRIVKSISDQKFLQPQALQMLVLVVERYALWREVMPVSAWKREVLKVFQPFVFLSAESLPEINKVLTKKAQEAFKEILSLISFDTFAPLQKWIFWAQLLERQNYEAARMGLRGFVKSKLFSDSSMKEFFLQETRNVFKKAPAESLPQLLEGLLPSEQDYLKELWQKSRS